ncbi:MAG: peptide chain release factor N(5)-glutamine methyltransferase [Actinomycetota bacterium]
MSIAVDLATAQRTLVEAGIETARHDAEWIAARALNVSRGILLARAQDDFSDDASKHFLEMIDRRARREPLAYVTGFVSFRGLELECGPGVLVPRPETEITVARAIARGRERGPKPTIVDVGTGSGAIGIALAAEVPNARIFATEASGHARGWALRNLARTGLRCTLLPGDLLDGLHPALGGGVDVVVANPPYVAEAEWAGLEPEVREWEPKEAIIAGPTGLEVILEVIEQARVWLAPGGWLVLEIASSQAERTARFLTINEYEDVLITKDLTGRERVVEARWTGVW